MTFASLLEQRTAFERTFPERVRQAVSKVEQAAALTNTKATPVKAKDEAVYAFKASPRKVQELQDNLQHWGIQVPAALLQPRDVFLSKEITWPDRYQFDLRVVGGSGAKWYVELDHLIRLLESYSAGRFDFTKHALTFSSDVRVVNVGQAPLFGGKVRLRAYGAQFQELQPGLATRLTAGLIPQKGFSEWLHPLDSLAAEASTHFTVRLDRTSWTPIIVEYQVEDQLGTIWGWGQLWVDQELAK